jgi:hypothetical protein
MSTLIGFMTSDNERVQKLAEIHAMNENAGRFWLEHDNARNLSRITEIPDPAKPWVSIPRSEWVDHDTALAIQDQLLRTATPPPPTS